MDSETQDLFCVPVLDKFLLYAPRRHVTALVNQAAVTLIQNAFLRGESVSGELASLFEDLRTEPSTALTTRTGPLRDPLFLGLVPTRGCNLNCQYCDFAAPKRTSQKMSLSTVRRAVDAYIALLQSVKKSTLEIHFFGGEPFYAWDSVFFAVEYARLRATEMGMETHFEVITNGMFSAARCRWIADLFDTVVLSIDGPAELHDRQRPALNGKGSFATLARNARILSDGPAELALRACISHLSVSRMPEIAAFFAQAFHPSSVCFETLTPSPLAQQAGLFHPDPVEFARGFFAAAEVLSGQGIETILSTADLNTDQDTFCPVGRDALIVSPDGTIDACYLLRQDWEEQGLDLRLGRLSTDGFVFEPGAVQRARDLTSRNKDACQDCLCRYHCAGGCHVRRSASPTARKNTEVCIQTRLITIATLLVSLGKADLAARWMGDRERLEAAALSLDDRLIRPREAR